MFPAVSERNSNIALLGHTSCAKRLLTLRIEHKPLLVQFRKLRLTLFASKQSISRIFFIKA
jgi:hypothetical protein